MITRILFFISSFFMAITLFAGAELIHDKKYYIKADNDNFISYDFATKSFTLSPTKKTKFIAKMRDGELLLQLLDNRYLSASDDGTITKRDNPWGWESFKLNELPGRKYNLKSTHNNFIRINYHTNKLDLSPNTGDGEAIEFIEAPQKDSVLVDGNWYYIKADNNMHVFYDENIGQFILSHHNKTRFKVKEKDDGKIHFRLSNNEYLSAGDDGTLTISPNAGDRETFTPDELLDGKYYARSFHNNYLRTNYHTYKLDLSPHKGAWEAIDFINIEEPRAGFLGDPLLTELEMLENSNKFAVYGNTVPTNFYMRTVPKATFLRDYGAGRWPSGMPLVMKIDSDRLDKLPQEIKNKLNENHVNEVDIYFIVQDMKHVIGNDWDGPRYTRLLPHGWADPHAPADFVSNRVNRGFLQGIFESDENIADEVRIGELKPFWVNTHDMALSPKNSRLYVDQAKSQSFYSLVIDHENPQGPKKAIITLHWLLNEEDARQFLDMTQSCYDEDAQGKQTPVIPCSLYLSMNDDELDELAKVAGLDLKTNIKPRRILKYKVFGALLKTLEISDVFKDKPMLNKLKKLVVK